MAQGQGRGTLEARCYLLPEHQSGPAPHSAGCPAILWALGAPSPAAAAVMGNWEGTWLWGGAKVAGHVDLQHSSESARVSVLVCLVHAGVCGPVHMWSRVWFMRLRVELDFLLNFGDWERP